MRGFQSLGRRNTLSHKFKRTKMYRMANVFDIEFEIFFKKPQTVPLTILNQMVMNTQLQDYNAKHH